LPEEDLDALVQGVLDADHAAIADALDICEDTRPSALATQRALIGRLEAKTPADHTVVGLTGPPGAGKSTLAGALIRHWLAAGKGAGMVAVDPTSRRSGGALLGDRARLRFGSGERVFVRSMAARDQLGGLAPATRAAVVVLRAAFDWTLVETVGVGQSEIDVETVADSVVLVLQPGSGDTLQFMKAGILEIPDVLVVHKWDLGALAERTKADLMSMLAIAPETSTRWTPRVLGVSALSGIAIDELAEVLREHRAHLDASSELARRRSAGRVAWAMELFQRRFGSAGVDKLGGAEALHDLCSGSTGSALDCFIDLASRAGLST
jgi:LAO/AO transport system kinase